MAANIPADHKLIGKLTEIVISNLEDENFGVDELARESGISLYRLNRRLHSINRKTVNQFIREIRLLKAREMLQNEEYNANEVAFRVGFSSPGYFSKCFHEYFGYPPGKIKKGEVFNLNRNVQDKKTSKRFIPVILIIALIFFSLAFLIHQGGYKFQSARNLISSDGRISITVLPFQNMTNDSLWDDWQDGIQTCLITLLTNSGELKVRQVETVNGYLKSNGISDYASITPAVGSKISQKLDAATFIYGSINQAGSVVRLNAQIINSRTDEILKSFPIDGSATTILNMIDSLSNMVKDFLIISDIKRRIPAGLVDQSVKTTNSEAYRLYIQGNKAFYKNDFPSAIDWYKQALAIDSNLFSAMGKIALSYYNDLNYKDGKEWCARFYGKKDKMAMREKIWADFVYAIFFRTQNERIKSMELLKEIDDRNPLTYFNSGDCYLELFEYDRAIIEFEKALKIFAESDTKPFWGAFYYELGIAYHKTDQFNKERRLYRKADADFPDDPGLMDQHAWLELTLGDTSAAKGYIEKWTSVRKKEAWSDARIAGYLAYIYDMARDTEKVEMCLRQALSFEPENLARMSSLAYFLIDKDQNINEGIELADKVLKKNPDAINALHAKGWAFYKQGKYIESHDLLQKSWDLRMQNSIYNHTAFLHLEEARKAVFQRP